MARDIMPPGIYVHGRGGASQRAGDGADDPGRRTLGVFGDTARCMTQSVLLSANVWSRHIPDNALAAAEVRHGVEIRTFGHSRLEKLTGGDLQADLTGNATGSVSAGGYGSGAAADA